ncbi:unnamed protein product [Urochloa humidicola]
MMKEYHLSARYRGQNGWTKEGWNSMVTRLNNKYPVSKFNVPQLKDREQRLKKDHNIVKSIVSKSGFGWNPEIKMATAIDEKWKELSEDQQKWRNKPFPYYDDLYDIYDGKVAEGKRCRRTTDGPSEKSNVNLSSQEDIVPESATYFGMGSPDTTRRATELDFDLGHEDWMNTNDTDSTYGDHISVPENSQNPSANQEEDRLENSAPSGMSQRVRSTGKGLEKTSAKKNKDAVLESLVALRKEELESYKELKSKQIESYKQVKIAQMEKNDPNNDPYSMAKCVAKLQELDILPAPELMKTVNYLKKDKLNREIFMTLKGDHNIIEFLKEAISFVEI